MIAKDWAEEAAIEIVIGSNRADIEKYLTLISQIRRIIMHHFPVEPDTAFMPVPRCATCKHWMMWQYIQYHTGQKAGECQRVDGVNTISTYTNGMKVSTLADFGCVEWEKKDA